MRAASRGFGARMEILKADVHPPLYYELLHGWVRLLGTTERRVRALSGLFYVLSVFAVYRLGRELYGDRAGLISAAIYLCSPLAILSAQFARMYSLLSLLAILSTWLYLQFSVRPHKSKLKFSAYVAANVLGTFTHIGFFFVIFAQFIYHVLFHRRVQIMRLLAALAISFIPYALIWGPVLLAQFSKSQEGLAWVSKPTVSTYVELFVVYGGVFWLFLPVFIYVMWRKGSRFSRSQEPKILPAWLFVITIVTPLLISQIKPIFNSRLAIVGLHLFALTAAGIVGKNKINYFLCFQMIVLSGIAMFVLHPGFSRCDNKATATYLRATTNDGDAVIFTSLTRLPIDYYLEQIPDGKRLFETSFPAEIDVHPGYEGRISDPNRRSALDDEARQLVEHLATGKSGAVDRRIFVLRGLHPELDAILDARLRERFNRVPESALKCDESSAYFREIVVYK